MANGGIEIEQVMQRDRRKCFVGEERVTLLDRDLGRQLDCTDLHLCWDWEKQRDTWQRWAMHAYCTWLVG